MKKYFYQFLFFSCLTLCLLLPTTVFANTINNIDMDIVVDSNGNAKITEIWDVDVNQGTEAYKPYGNLEDMVITNFSVTDENGKLYTFIDPWDVNASFSEKAYKNGINYTSDGLELCYGISNYGAHRYTMKYDVSNFVRQLTDSQMIYFGFIPSKMSVPPNKIDIKIRAPFKFDETNSKIWSYGYVGTVLFEDGIIRLRNTEALKKEEYTVGLVKINNGLFTLINNSDKDFKYYQDMANNGAVDRGGVAKGGPVSWIGIFFGVIFAIISFIFSVLPFLLVMGAIGLFAYMKNNKTTTSNTKLPNIKSVNYFREIPANNNLEKAYWLADTYKIYRDKSGIMGAILLKWLRNDLITITKTKKGFFDFKDNNYAIDLNKITTLDTDTETKLHDMYMKASGDGILETKEFVKWCGNNYDEVMKWFEDAANAGYDLYKNDSLITETKVSKKILFFNKEITQYVINPALEEEGKRLLGLKKFLLEYGSIPDKPAMQVKLWEDYLIFAAILGIADKVAEQFSKLYPDFKTLSNLDPDMTAPAIIIFAHSGYESAHNAEVASHASSGSGGGSFSGGGGGSFGGSSGGGFR